MVPLALIGNIGLPEIMIILMIGLLLFGARLPEVGRSLGRGLLEFKKGLRGMQDQMDGLERDADRRVDEELARRQTDARVPTQVAAEDQSPGAPSGATPASAEKEAPSAHGHDEESRPLG